MADCIYHIDHESRIEKLEESTGQHIQESNQPGGYRDRLLVVEKKQEEHEKSNNYKFQEVYAAMRWGIALCGAASFVGSLIGKMVPTLEIILQKVISG